MRGTFTCPVCVLDCIVLLMQCPSPHSSIVPDCDYSEADAGLLPSVGLCGWTTPPPLTHTGMPPHSTTVSSLPVSMYLPLTIEYLSQGQLQCLLWEPPAERLLTKRSHDYQRCEIMKYKILRNIYKFFSPQMVFSGLISAPVYVIYLIVGVWFLFQVLLEIPLVLCTRHKAYQSVSL